MPLPTVRTKESRQKALKRAETETPEQAAKRHARLDKKRKEAHAIARKNQGRE